MQCSGHIRKRTRKNGTSCWQIILELPPDYVTGKRKREYKTFEGTKKGAEEYKRKLIQEYESGMFTVGNKITVGDWVQEYHKEYVKPRTSETTYANYLKIIKAYILPEIGGINLKTLTTLDVQQWINEIKDKSPMSGKPVSPKTLRNIFRVLSPAMKKAKALRMVSENPCDLVELPRNTHKSNEHIYDIELVQELIKAAEDSGNIMRIVVPLLLSTGLRRGELLDLKYSDIDFDKEQIRIETSRVIAGNEVVVKGTKTCNSQRVLVVSATVMQMLKSERNEYIKRKLKYGVNFYDTDLVVCKANGQAYYPQTISNLFARMLDKNGIQHLRLHDLRALNATIMISECNIDPRTASARLGHSNSNFTLAVYANCLKSANKDAAEKLDKVFFADRVSC